MYQGLILVTIRFCRFSQPRVGVAAFGPVLTLSPPSAPRCRRQCTGRSLAGAGPAGKLMRGDIELQVLPHAEAGAARLQAVFYQQRRGGLAHVGRLRGQLSLLCRVCGIARCCSSKTGPARVTRQSLKPHWFMPLFEPSSSATTARALRVDRHRTAESGDLQHMQGSWRFDPVARPAGCALLVTPRDPRSSRALLRPAGWCANA